MKKLILLLLLVIPVIAIAQDTKDITLYRCYKFGYSKINPSTGKLGGIEWREANSIVRVNIKEDKIILPAEKDFTLYMVRKTFSETKIDEDGDKYVLSVFDAVDQDGDDCVFMQKDFVNYTYIIFMVVYPSFSVILHCNIIG